MPWFSIIIPTYNRPQHTCDAIDSILSQSFEEFEIVVVDDASTDETPETVAAYTDPRVRLVRHEVNQQLMVSRNTGAKNARGEWLIFLDSDQQLLEGALARLHELTQSAAATVGRIGVMFRYDVGGESPDPAPEEGVVDYEGWLRWCGLDHRRQDFLPCTRAATFATVQYPLKGSGAIGYNLNFAREFDTWWVPEACALLRTDATNRRQSVAGYRRAAALAAPGYREMLESHGEAMLRVSPAAWRLVCRGTATWCFFDGDRLNGLRYGLRYLRHRPWSPEMWLSILSGLLGPGAALRIRALKYRYAQRRTGNWSA